MSVSREGCVLLEIRETLANLRNKDGVVRALQNRGVTPEEARELVHSIQGAILTAIVFPLVTPPSTAGSRVCCWPGFWFFPGG